MILDFKGVRSVRSDYLNNGEANRDAKRNYYTCLYGGGDRNYTGLEIKSWKLSGERLRNIALD